jgi:hypothetical protein
MGAPSQAGFRVLNHAQITECFARSTRAPREREASSREEQDMTASEDPTQGREVGEQPNEDPTQGREVGEQPNEDPTQGS